MTAVAAAITSTSAAVRVDENGLEDILLTIIEGRLLPPDLYDRHMRLCAALQRNVHNCDM
jgi:hypothetical protein